MVGIFIESTGEGLEIVSGSQSVFLQGEDALALFRKLAVVFGVELKPKETPAPQPKPVPEREVVVEPEVMPESEVVEEVSAPKVVPRPDSSLLKRLAQRRQ
jgi:hypothetical protein